MFEDFAPQLSPAARACDVLFLANIGPALQTSVLDQCISPRWTALDSMNLWIDIARDDLVAAIERVDCVVLNDAEVRQLTAQPSILSAGRELLSWGPSAVVAKQGEYGAVLITEDSYFALPAYPVDRVVDPTGAGDTFAGGMVGYIAAQPDRVVDHDLLATAMAYGTAIASYNVEAFGTERVARLTRDEIEARVADLLEITHFDHPSLETTSR